MPMAAAFALAMAIQAAVPGPGVLTTVAQSLSGGMRHGLPLVLGIVAGDVIYALLAVLALSAVAKAVGEVFVVVKLAGAAYLAWMGIRMWIRAPKAPGASHAGSGRTRTGKFLLGLVTTLSNPKAILFYGGFLPVFFELDRFNAADTLILVLIVSVVLSGVLLAYGALASYARGVFRSTRALRRVNRVAGTAMLASAAATALRR